MVEDQLVTKVTKVTTRSVRTSRIRRLAIIFGMDHPTCPTQATKTQLVLGLFNILEG